MPEPPHDPLAEHPLGASSAARSSSTRGTLDLFPDIAQTPLVPTSATVPPPVREAAPRLAASSGEEIDEPGEMILDEPSADSGSVAFARRLVSGLADLVILGLFGAVELASGALLLELRFPPAALVGVAAFLFLAALVLLVLVPMVWGTTPGMALAGLKVEAADGGLPTLSAAFFRFAGFLLTGLLAGVPLLVSAFDRQGRSFSDIISRTALVPAPKPRP